MSERDDKASQDDDDEIALAENLSLGSNGSADSFPEIADVETWSITRRDRPLTNAAAIGAMDHAHTVLKERLSQDIEGIDTSIFNKSLPRFLNSEIDLGKRIAFGMFADIFCIRKWKEAKSVKPCSPEQIEAAAIIMQRTLPEELIIKVLRPSLLMNPDLYATGAADILTEATLLATLDHPNVVKICGRSVASVEGFASGKRDSFFLVLERLECNFLDLLARWKEQSNDNGLMRLGLRAKKKHRLSLLLERVNAMLQLAGGISYLHSKMVLHRDLKLSNIAVARNGTIKLLDFGLARILPPHNVEKDTFKLTSNTGSIRYMAPEIARGDNYNLKADIFSFSMLLYEVLNLEKVWNGLKPEEIRTKVVQKKQRPKPSMFWPVALRSLLKSTWSDTPAGRLSITHVQAVLENQEKVLQKEVLLAGDDIEPSGSTVNE